MQDFKHKRILITGITGFVGSHLAKRLVSLGADVFGISKTEEAKNIFKANIVDYSVIDGLIKDMKFYMCFHLAGESLVEYGQMHPYEAFKINITGTLNILESAREHKMERIIIASTAHVYGNNKLPYIETYTPKPTRPYETSKTCTDLIAQSYKDTFNLPVLIPRFVNIYGPGDTNFNRLIPQTIKAILSDTRPKMWGGRAVRDYLYIDDAIDAYIQLANVDLSLLGNNSVFNFGSGSRISVRDLIQKIIDLSGRNLTIKREPDKRTSEIKTQYVSPQKAKKVLAWKSKVSLDQGIIKTLAWYTAYFKK